jgi:hypothetical protein
MNAVQERGTGYLVKNAPFDPHPLFLRHRDGVKVFPEDCAGGVFS